MKYNEGIECDVKIEGVFLVYILRVGEGDHMQQEGGGGQLLIVGFGHPFIRKSQIR